MRSFRRTLEYLKPYRWRLVLAVVLTLFVTTLQVVPPRLFQFAIDEGVTPAVEAQQEIDGLIEAEQEVPPELAQRVGEIRTEEGPRTLVLVGVALMLVIGFRSLFSYLMGVTVATIGHRFCFDLRFATWRHLQRLSLAYHKQSQTGKVMSRATSDIELIQGLIQGQLVTFLSDLITVMAVLAMLFVLEWRVALIIVALVPLYVTSYQLIRKPIRALRDEQRRLYDAMVGYLAEKIAGIAVVKAFVREREETTGFMTAVRAKFAMDRRQIKLNRGLGLIAGVISALGTGLVYAYGGDLVQRGEMTVGELVAITFYIGYVFNPAVRVVDFNTALQWAIAAMDRVFQTLDTRPDIEDSPDAVPLPSLGKGIQLDSVTFRYADGAAALSDVNLTVRPGEVIGVVGHSGAGKTTLMNVLMRFYDPSEGRVLFDGIDLRQARIDSLRQQVSMVAQENVIFSVSIAENVKYGARGATQEQVEAACQAAEMHDFILEMQDGYETRIGDNGIKLSGGQRQRLALARALVTDPSVLILDDVTSALDGETEAKVQEALRKVMRGRTTFIVAHRLSSVVEADRIVVLEAGRIVDVGSHEELVARPGIYKEMYEEQFRSALEPTA